MRWDGQLVLLGDYIQTRILQTWLQLFIQEYLWKSSLYKQKNLLRAMQAFLFPFFGEWLSWNVSQHHSCTTMATWYIFGAYLTVKIKLPYLGVCDHVYRFLKFSWENQVVLYFVLYWNFFCLCCYLWQVSHLCLLHESTPMGDFSFILFLRFIAEDKKRWLLNLCWISSCSSGSFRNTRKKVEKSINKNPTKYWNN